MTAAPDPNLETDHRSEWVGGIMTLPRYVTEHGETYKPSVIAWLDVATEMILGTSIVAPKDAVAAAAANLRDTAKRLNAGRPGMLGRIRVATQELADALRRESIDGVEVVCGPTPEFDRAISALLDHLGGDDEEPELRYLRGNATPEGTAAMFRAAARLYRAKPWDVVPSDHSLIGVTSGPLRLRDAVVSVIGQAGLVRGFALFASFDGFDRFVEAADRAARSRPASFPRHLALTYASRAEVGPGMLAEIATHRWELANRSAYPIISAIDEAGVGRGPTRGEMLRVEAIAASLAEIFRKYPSEMEEAFADGAPLVLRKALATSAGEVELEVSAPHPEHQDAETLLDDGELDERAAIYRTEILRRFEASPEARQPPAVHWAAMLVDYAASQFGTTVESLSPAQLREIVFEVVPRKVGVEPAAAPAIVAGLRAFLAFLRRERPDRQAAGRLAVLEGDASQRLARLLADPSNFGPAKSFVMSGRAAGFDTSSQAGLDAWAEHMRNNDLRVPMGPLVAAAPRRDGSVKQRGAQPAKTAKRKAQRPARKPNRSR
jgi:hypothetical protein